MIVQINVITGESAFRIFDTVDFEIIKGYKNYLLIKGRNFEMSIPDENGKISEFLNNFAPVLKLGTRAKIIEADIIQASIEQSKCKEFGVMFFNNSIKGTIIITPREETIAHIDLNTSDEDIVKKIITVISKTLECNNIPINKIMKGYDGKISLTLNKDCSVHFQ